MARIIYTYQSYPDCPRATKYSERRAKVGVILSIFIALYSIGVAIVFFAYTNALFLEGNWGDFLIAALLIILFAFLTFYFILD